MIVIEERYIGGASGTVFVARFMLIVTKERYIGGTSVTRLVTRLLETG